MSIKLMTKVWENGPEDRTETIVLLALADRANDDGSSCYPSIAEVAQRSRLSRRGTQKVIRRLDQGGYLDVNENAGPSGVNKYKLHPSKLDGRTEFGGEHDSHGGEHDSHGGEQAVHGGGEHGSPVTVNEPSNNRQESAPAREEGDQEFDPVEMLVDMWSVRPTAYQQDKIRSLVTDEDEWRAVLDDLKMQNKDSKKAIGWAVSNYRDQNDSADAHEAEPSAKEQGGHHWDDDGFLRGVNGNKVRNPRGYPIRK